MARLLVLSLAETTSDPTKGYAVIARNIDNSSWVIIPTLPKELLRIEEEYAWDIFAVTEVEIRRVLNLRSDIYEVEVENYLPKMIAPPIKSVLERIKVLNELSSDTITELSESTSWVGILKNPRISNLTFSPRKENELGYDRELTFYWECRLDFSDIIGSKWKYKVAPGVAVKDMRFKAYWRDILLTRQQQFRESIYKWIDYMILNNTYLLIEFYPNDYYGQIAVISGVFSLKID
ncbi:hypothetical protein HUB98_09930 [Paenibacillus barcinonensis]|uniref:Uncharacterized protein n=1 Tax=Paenibacillus barcinonensis TaxID=198119 RepID=A0A2V4VST4_PAEBA|nr:hypothetical protein [Paenibacillus barcinonensis]PYE49669.1 hypothetical protein DFQ00_105173 [Paenibacillus barcinonensis]QKS56625.1 hypothetical protein HUB98_09930 [Paenibacillus barcinonensis]